MLNLATRKDHLKQALYSKYYSKLDKLTHGSSKVYIVPSKAGLKYLFINFTVFLMAMTYTNNLCLLISFIMVSYFILQMLDTHKIIQDVKIKDFKISNQFGPTVHSSAQLEKEIPEDYFKLLQFELSSPKYQLKSEKPETFKTNFLNCEFSHVARGHYIFKRVKAFTLGQSHLFYVWRYFHLPQHFYIYPEKSYFQYNDKKIDNTLKLGHFEAEFSEHIPYQVGMNSKRIDWKIYSRSDQLYIKKHIDFHNTTYEVDYQKLDGAKEERLSYMSFLIDKYYQENKSWKLILPNKVLSSDHSMSHYKKSMELISVF